MQVGSLPNKRLPDSSEEGERDPVVGLLKNAVVKGLGHFAPNSTVEILIQVLEQEHSVDFQTIPDNPGSLREGLSRMFGSAEDVVEAKICQALGKQLGVDSEGKSLEDLISMSRTNLLPEK